MWFRLFFQEVKLKRRNNIMSDLIKIDNQEFNLDKKNETFFAHSKNIADIFDTTRQNVELHLKNIFKDRELEEISVCKDFLLTGKDNKKYQVKHYNFDCIIAVGYRINSKKATEFRITRHGMSYLIKNIKEI